MRALILLPLLAGCAETITLNKAPPPPEKLTCKADPEKPELPALDMLTLPDGTKVYRVEQVHAREGVVARYIVEIRGVTFDCRSQLGWNRDYWAE